MNDVSTIRRLMVVLSIATLATIVLVVVVWTKLSNVQDGVVRVQGRVIQDERTTCIIQNRSLRSQRYLVGSLDGLHQLLTLPPTAASKRNQRQIPPRELRRELALLKSLNMNLAAYVAIDREQPGSRACLLASG